MSELGDLLAALHEAPRQTRLAGSGRQGSDPIKMQEAVQRSNRRPFPTWSEVLEVLRSLGYRKTEEATALPGLPVHPNGD